MLLPIRTKNPPESLPAATILLMVINVTAFAVTQQNGVIRREVLENYGLIPARLEAMDFLTSMFLHGNAMHLIGNMWFLYLMGFAVEGRLGSIKFSALYLLAGLAGDLLHILFMGAIQPNIPCIGASGAIMGCLGAALYMFPFSQVMFFYFFWVRAGVTTWPMWFVATYYLGLDFLGALLSSLAGGGGVAHLAHLGGALGGFLSCLILKAKRDNKQASDAKATLDEIQDITLIPPEEMRELCMLHPEKVDFLMQWMRSSISYGNKPTPECLEVFHDRLHHLAEKADSVELGEVINHLSLEGHSFSPHPVLRTALRVEQRGNPKLAFRLYECVLKSNPNPDDQQAAIFRVGVVAEESLLNYQHAAQCYRWLDQHHSMGAFTEQARQRLTQLETSGKLKTHDWHPRSA